MDRSATDLRRILSTNKKNCPACAAFSKMKKAELSQAARNLQIYDNPVPNGGQRRNRRGAVQTPVPTPVQTPVRRSAVYRDLLELKDSLIPYDTFRTYNKRAMKNIADSDIRRYDTIINMYRNIEDPAADDIADEIRQIFMERDRLLA